MKEKIGTRLRDVREQHNLSQTALAEKLGMTQKAISSWENDRTYPRMQQLLDLCRIYDCTLEYLTGTKQHDSKDVTYDDIVAKLWDFDLDRLHDLQYQIDMVIHNQEEIIRIEMEKAQLKSHLLEYERRLNELSKK